MEVVMEVVMDVELARSAIALVDLTDLSDNCTEAAIDALCDRAARYHTAAVCVWPDFVAQSSGALSGTGVRVATVVNFPSGAERPFAVALVTQKVLADGADEVDVVLPYRAFAAGEVGVAARMLDGVRRATDGSALMKVILETGELVDLDLVRAAAELAVEHGADFIKTSTGKSPVSATLPAAETMLAVIAAAGRPVGIKPSGGISTVDDAQRYIDAAERVMGDGWVAPGTFRFGASGLLNALLVAAGESVAVQASSSSY
jgi:deoxyribose-phosphate aldolase